MVCFTQSLCYVISLWKSSIWINLQNQLRKFVWNSFQPGNNHLPRIFVASHYFQYYLVTCHDLFYHNPIWNIKMFPLVIQYFSNPWQVLTKWQMYSIFKRISVWRKRKHKRKRKIFQGSISLRAVSKIWIDVRK